jgi:hypothetical protein
MRQDSIQVRHSKDINTIGVITITPVHLPLQIPTGLFFLIWQRCSCKEQLHCMVTCQLMTVRQEQGAELAHALAPMKWQLVFVQVDYSQTT